MDKGSEKRVLDDDEVWGLHGKLLGNLENEASNQHVDTLLGLRVEGGISTEESVDPNVSGLEHVSARRHSSS